MLKPPQVQLQSKLQTPINTPLVELLQAVKIEEHEPLPESQESIALPQSKQHSDDIEFADLLEQSQPSAADQAQEQETEEEEKQTQEHVVDIVAPAAPTLSWICQECDREDVQVLGVYCLRCIKSVKFCIRCGDVEPMHHRASRLRHGVNATRLIYYCMPCAVRECNHREMMQMAAAHLPAAAQLP